MIEALLGFIAGLTAGYYIERHKTLEALAEIRGGQVMVRKT